MITTKEEYMADRASRAPAVPPPMPGQPIPTQEELDLMRLGLMHVDEKGPPELQQPPPVAVPPPPPPMPARAPVSRPAA
jgi:hypothetical protein